VGSALLSVAVVNTLRSGALADTDFRRPDEVLSSLNRAYPMESQDDLYFTIWYGVYHQATGRLRYASAGHPAPLVARGPSSAQGNALHLRAAGPALGVMPNVRYTAEEITLVSPARLFVFSDGVYEISTPSGKMLEYAAFVQALSRPAGDGASQLDDLLRFAREVRGEAVLEDDFSIIKMTV
jgi:serine phosphatase RsbU (regulator of sigma subunit)